MSESRTLASAIALALFLSGCMVGPDHVRPEIATPAHFLRDETVAPTAPHTAPAATLPNRAAGVDAGFWRRFDDPLLTMLVDEALTANHDLRIALARLEQARALARQTGFDRGPTVTASAGASATRASADQVPGVSDRDSESHDAGIGMSWELDLFGRVRRGVQAQRAEAAAAAGDLAAVQVAVAADVAQAYFELRGRQAQLAAARAGAELQQGSLALVDARLAAGRGTELDTSRATVELASTRGRIPALEADVAATMHRLAVLTGRTPDAWVEALSAPQPLPSLDDAVDPGTPGELLRRRPDIAAAERRLEAATARVGVATADLFPRFTLGGLLGSQAGDAGALFGGGSESGFVALGIDWSFLDVGRVRARIAAAEAGADENLARYEQTVLRALEETETALVRHANARAERRQLEIAAAAGARAAELARLRFDGGLVDFLQVLDAERARVEADDRLAQSQARTSTARVAVYRALAGGWPERLPPPALAAR